MTVPFLELKKVNAEIEDELEEAFRKVLMGGQYILGLHLSSFEREFAKYCATKFCIGVGNGLNALELIIQALHFSKGSEIIVPANTCIATIMAISNTGHVPVLTEPSLTDYTIDTNKIKQRITKKTKAIIAVHLYGRCCDMTSLKEIANEYNLFIIEDAAQAHGSIYNNQKAGSFGIAAAFSFYPTKNLGAIGDGGAIITNNEALSKEVEHLRNYGSINKNIHQYIGTNSRLDDLQAIFLSIKLKTLDIQNNKRRIIARTYLQHLSGASYILPPNDSIENDNWHLFVIRHPKRNALASYLKKNGILTAIHYPKPIHKQEAYISLSSEKFPIAERLAEEVLSLPCNPHIDEASLDYVIKVLKDFE